MPENKDTKQILKSVRKIEIQTRGLVEGLVQGSDHSVFKGRGIEFSEVREYQYGDDIRTIDWNVTARMDEPFIKEFIEERDLTVLIVYDASGSVTFGSDRTKADKALECAASLMFAAMRNNDKVGLIRFSDAIERYIPPRKGRRHVLRIIRELMVDSKEGRGTDLAEALRFISHVVKKRAIIFVVSDFFTSHYIPLLRPLSRRHDCIAVQVTDPAEEELPDVGYAFIEDAETRDQVLVHTGDTAFRKAYHERARRAQRSLETAFKKNRIDLIRLSTDQPLHIPLSTFFRLRKRRMR